MKNLSRFVLTLILAIISFTNVRAQANSSPASTSSSAISSASTSSANTASTATMAAKPSEQSQLPAIALPRLASIHIRIDDDTIEKEKAFASLPELRSKRDLAMRNLAAIELRGAVSANELGKVADAVNAVNSICAMGTDYIQLRLKKNSSRQFMVSLITGFFGVATAAAPVVSTARAAGIAGLVSGNYKTDVVENGDAGRSNTDLKKVLEDVRYELASGIQNYNRALLMPIAEDGAKLAQFRHLQAAVFEMHAACAYF
jgi:hypothetical protein